MKCSHNVISCTFIREYRHCRGMCCVQLQSEWGTDIGSRQTEEGPREVARIQNSVCVLVQTVHRNVRIEKEPFKVHKIYVTGRTYSSTEKFLNIACINNLRNFIVSQKSFRYFFPTVCIFCIAEACYSVKGMPKSVLQRKP